MKYPPHILDEIRARLPVSAVVGRKVGLKKKGREFAGLSPFKTEKTPSFFVNDQKGFYHCFASGEHGDIFSFLMETEGLTFPEAVERLASEAGVSLPKPTAEEYRREEQRLRLHEIQEAAAKIFEADLRAPVGAEARAYLTRRGLSEETIRTFRIGFASPDRTALLKKLKAAGFSDAELEASGLIVMGPDIRTPYDRFRNRVMFPIQDLKSRVIAFGGRALEADQPAKYLNSPETPLFHKGHVLFNAAGARQTAFDTGEIVIVEGYMDVIALAQAGYRNAVAPLGTALTPDQLKLLWRFSNEPLLCFDGDSAGRKAAHRALDTALPLLGPGRSVKFVFLPDGLDPDDLIRERGADALGKAFAASDPFLDVLWARAWGNGEWNTPEQRALLERQLSEQVGKIEDGGVRTHYQSAIRDRFYHAWRAKNQERARAQWVSDRSQAGSGSRGTGGGWSRQSGGSGKSAPKPAPSAALRSSALVSNEAAADADLEFAILRALVMHPELLDEMDEVLVALDFRASFAAQGLQTLLEYAIEENPLDTRHVRSHLHVAGMATLIERIGLQSKDQDDAHVGELSSNAGPGESGSAIVRRLIDRHRIGGLKKELQLALEDFEATGCDESLAQVIELKSVLSAMETAEASPDDAFTP